MKMTNKEKTAQKTEIHDRIFRPKKHPDKNASRNGFMWDRIT